MKLISRVAESIPEITMDIGQGHKNKFMKRTIIKRPQQKNLSSQEDECLTMLERLSFARTIPHEMKNLERDVSVTLGGMHQAC